MCIHLCYPPEALCFQRKMAYGYIIKENTSSREVLMVTFHLKFFSGIIRLQVNKLNNSNREMLELTFHLG